jgi:hypothetical protein
VKHRHPATLRLTTILSLWAALLAAGAIIAKPTVAPPSRPGGGFLPEVALAEAYPGARPITIGLDGYTPLFFIDEKRSVGTMDAADGASLLVMHGAGVQRELRRLPRQRAPEFAGFVADGARLLWLELTVGDQGRAESSLWTIDSPDAAPHMITDDTGDVALFDKRDDLVVHGGEVSWIAAGPGDQPQTEIRTVPLVGGEVRVDKRDGAYAFAGWPWLTTANLGQNGPIELRNLLTSERFTVPVRPNELMSCSPAWCRSIIIGGGQASTIIELQKPDGSKRFRAVSGMVAASLVDVALLDRFEVYSYSGGRLVVLDIERKQLIVVAKAGVTQVISRGTVLWWATGDNEAIAWHALNLKSLITP